jgi:hypothetical protein
MTAALDALVLDLVEWVAKAPRPYADVMDAWRTSCPRLTVWEEAVDRGYVESKTSGTNGVIVTVTPRGTALLQSNARASLSPATLSADSTAA